MILILVGCASRTFIEIEEMVRDAVEFDQGFGGVYKRLLPIMYFYGIIFNGLLV